MCTTVPDSFTICHNKCVTAELYKGGSESIPGWVADYSTPEAKSTASLQLGNDPKSFTITGKLYFNYSQNWLGYSYQLSWEPSRTFISSGEWPLTDKTTASVEWDIAHKIIYSFF